MGISPLRFDPAVARRIRLVGLDVDGILTDGMVYVGKSGQADSEFKRFDIRDGLGIKFMMQCGIHVAFISGRFSEATLQRARELKVPDVIQDDGAAKLEPFQQLLNRYKISWDEAAFMGDDLPDIPILRRVGLAVTVSDAMEDVKAIAAHATSRPGGSAAVREFSEGLLRARGEWNNCVEAYLAERGEVVQELSRV